MRELKQAVAMILGVRRLERRLTWPSRRPGGRDRRAPPAQCLATKRAVDLLALVLEARQLAVVLLPFDGDEAREIVAQEADAVRAEEAPLHEVEELVERDLLLDAERAGVAGWSAATAPRVQTNR